MSNSIQNAGKNNAMSVLPARAPDDGEALNRSYVQTEQSYQKILLAVMKNQIPGEDRDPMKMMEGVFQMISAGQQSKQTHILEKFGNQFNQLLQVSMGGYIGRQVGFESDKIMLKDQPRDIMFTMPPSARNAEIHIFDKYNNPVFQQELSTKAGLQHFVWDGHNQNNQDLPQGEYRVLVKIANHQGSEKALSTVMVGQVDEVSVNKEGKNVVIVDNQAIPIQDIRSASRVAEQGVTPELVRQIAASLHQRTPEDDRLDPQLPPLSPMQQAMAAYQSNPLSSEQRALNNLSSLV